MPESNPPVTARANRVLSFAKDLGNAAPRVASRRETDLRRRVHAVGDAFEKLAVSTDSPGDADRHLAHAWGKLSRMGAALRRMSEELAAERMHSRQLEAELTGLRARLQKLDRRPD